MGCAQIRGGSEASCWKKGGPEKEILSSRPPHGKVGNSNTVPLPRRIQLKKTMEGTVMEPIVNRVAPREGGWELKNPPN